MEDLIRPDPHLETDVVDGHRLLVVPASPQDHVLTFRLSLPDQFGPPDHRLARIDDQMRYRQGKSRSSEDHREQQTMDSGVNIPCGMEEICLVAGHPVVLQQPVGEEMEDETPDQKFTG